MAVYKVANYSYSGNEGGVVINSGVDCYVFVRKSLRSIFNILPVFISGRENQTYLHRTSLPKFSYKNHDLSCFLTIDGLQ